MFVRDTSRDLCARCACYATDEVYCKRHYEQWLREWSCPNCGDLNGGSVNRNQKNCAKCRALANIPQHQEA